MPDFKANSKAGFFGKLGGPKSVPLFGSKSPDADKAKVKSGLEGKKTVETGEESERRLIEVLVLYPLRAGVRRRVHCTAAPSARCRLMVRGVLVVWGER